ncbi:MAG: DNA recombination protein RmuC [Acidobacteria bacterium]|nr:DNA recombination protein RmuC [Acidobacteriota bacterium]
MEQFGLALILFASFWVGCAAGFIAMRLRTLVSYEKGRSESAAEIATANERLAAKESQFGEMKQKADLAATAITRLEAELRTETDRRTMAEAQLALLPKYEAEVATHSAKINEQTQELTKLHSSVSELTTRLEESRKAAAEKVVAVQQLQGKLAESIQIAGAESVKASQEAFLQLASDAFAKLQTVQPLTAEGAVPQNEVAAAIAGLQERVEALVSAQSPAPQSDVASAIAGLQRQMESLRESKPAETPVDLVAPLQASLERVDARIQELEAERAGALSGLAQQVESLLKAQTAMTQSLRLPSAHGNWGALQLQRVVELSGLAEYCVFAPETDAPVPGLVVQLPGERHIAVDTRAPLAAFLSTTEAPEEKRTAHAAAVRAYITELSERAYWDQFTQSPEFVVAFLPSEAYFGVALEQDPSLLEYGVEHRVVLSTPATLIALLKAVAWGWKHEKVSVNARELRELGKALYDHIRTIGEHFTEVQRGLSRTTAAFNRTVGSFETTLLPAARRFREVGSPASLEFAAPPPVDTMPRSLHLLAEAVPAVEEELVPIVELETVPAAEACATPGAAVVDASAVEPKPVVSEVAPVALEEPVAAA